MAERRGYSAEIIVIKNENYFFFYGHKIVTVLRYLQNKQKRWCFMKQWIALLLIILITAALCACQSDKKDDKATEAPAETVAQTQAATEAPTQAAAVSAQAAAPVDASWFDDAVFVGDSVTVALDYACSDDKTLLGDAKFVCAQSLGYHNALWSLDTEGAVHPTYQGTTVLAETAAQVTGATKVFVMLGVNDIGTYGADDTMEEAKKLAERILSHSANVKLYFQSTTPMLADKESGWLNNDKITAFNELLKAYCEEKGYFFIDVYHQVCDNSGALNPAYCGDPDNQGIHFNVEGCTVWAKYLKSAVAEFENAADMPTDAPATEAPAAAVQSDSVADSGNSDASSDDGTVEINYFVPDDQ